MKKKPVKIIIRIVLAVLLLLILAVGGYVIYMQHQYYRIDDFTSEDTENNREAHVLAGSPYTITTYNIGFGAYEDDYTFFMDTGKMKDGTATKGKYSRGLSKEHTLANTQGSLEILKKLDSDFYFIQEADVSATRSYDVNQVEMIGGAFENHGLVYTSAFHSAYLFYPFTSPHGRVESGLVTLSKYHIDENVRRQFPVDTSFITKFFDLDRCFTVSRLPVDNGKELVLICLHMSAYDEGGTIRRQQLEMLNGVLAEERAKGNYVIAGGDFNHDIAGTIDAFESDQEIPEWVYQLDSSDLAEGFSFVIPENVYEVPSCRGADIPYEKGVDYTVTVDGFIISDNIQASSKVTDTEFKYTDHQPVTMTFELAE